MEMAVKNRQTVKRLKELTLLDRFLFAETMEDKRNLQLILSILYPPCPLIYGGMGDISIPSGWPARNRQDCCWRMGQAQAGKEEGCKGDSGKGVCGYAGRGGLSDRKNL